MSQSRFSIVLVGVSALLRRPLVSRLRPADGERSSWVVFTARRCLPFRRLPLGGLTLPPSTSGLPLGELAFGLTASAFRHAPLRGCPRRVGSSAFRFGDGRSAGWPSGSRLPLFGTHRFGVAARWVGASARRVDLRAHDFRFSARTASGLPSAGWFFCLPLRSCRSAGWCFRLPFRGCHSAGWPSGSPLPLFGTHRFGVALGELAFGLTTSAFRHAPLRGYPRRVGSSARRVGLRAHGFRFSACADPHRRAADARADGAHRHDTCFTSKHLSQHVNLPHRTP